MILIQVFCPAFYVVVDHVQQTVVVAIRGSLSIKVDYYNSVCHVLWMPSPLVPIAVLSLSLPQDALTDLSAHPSLLTMSEKGDFYGHKV